MVKYFTVERYGSFEGCVFCHLVFRSFQRDSFSRYVFTDWIRNPPKKYVFYNYEVIDVKIFAVYICNIDMLNFNCEFCLACILNNISQKLQRMITIYTCNFSKHLLIYFQDCGTTTVGFGTSTTTQTPSNNAGQYQGGRGGVRGFSKFIF